MTTEPDYPEKWTFPGYDVGQPEEKKAAAEPESKFIPLCTIAKNDAQPLCADLESHGLPCEALPPAMTDNDSQITILVRAEDLDEARRVLIGQVQIDPAELEEEERDRDAAFAAQWICPHCRERVLKPSPLSTSWRRIRLACLGLFLLPFLMMLMIWVVPNKALADAYDRISDRWRIIWVLIVGGMAAVLILAHRERHCPACGWNSKTAETDK